MRKSKAGAIIQWSWLPLLAIILILFAELRNLSRETQSFRTRAEVLSKQASEIRVEEAAATEPTPAAVVSIRSANKSTKPPGLANFSDGNAMGDPEYGAIIARRQRRYAMGNYRQAIDAMHLSRADEDRLKQLITEQWNARVDASDIVQRMGDGPPAFREKAVEAAQVEAQQKIRAFLGDDAYAKFQATYEESAANQMNWGLVTDLWDVDIPLTSDQQTALARAQQQVRSQFPQQENHSPIGPETELSESDLALLRAVASFLSPEQVAFIQEDRIAQARYRKALRAVNQRRASSAGAGR
jgi:hypothetical protein